MPRPPTSTEQKIERKRLQNQRNYERRQNRRQAPQTAESENDGHTGAAALGEDSDTPINHSNVAASDPSSSRNIPQDTASVAPSSESSSQRRSERLQRQPQPVYRYSSRVSSISRDSEPPTYRVPSLTPIPREDESDIEDLIVAVRSLRTDIREEEQEEEGEIDYQDEDKIDDYNEDGSDDQDEDKSDDQDEDESDDHDEDDHDEDESDYHGEDESDDQDKDESDYHGTDESDYHGADETGYRDVTDSDDVDNAVSSTIAVRVPRLSEVLRNRFSDLWTSLTSIYCTCPGGCYSTQQGVSLAAISEFLRHGFPLSDDGEILPLSLDGEKRLGAKDFRNHDWRRILTGGLSPPELSLKASQDECMKQFQEVPLKISTKYDVDSILAAMPTFGACKWGLRLEYAPRYGTSIESNQNMGKMWSQAAKSRNYKIAVPENNSDLGIFIVFPHSSGGVKNNHPTDEILEFMTDQIILPYIRSLDDAQLLTRHPRSFKDVRTKSHVKYESSKQGYGALVPVRAFLPERYAAGLWAYIQEQLDGHRPEPIARLMRAPYLLMMGHGFKQQYCADDPIELRSRLRENLERTFHVGDGADQLSDIHLDFGIEWVPSTQSPPVTLISKRRCNDMWADLQQPEGPGAKKQHFHWQATRDASTVTVVLHEQNPIRRLDQMLTSKRYNAWKDVFAVNPVRGGGFFEDEQDISYTVLTDTHAAELRSKGDHSKSNFNLSALSRQRYRRGRERMYAALKNSECSWQLRTEYRISYKQFHETVLAPTEPISLLASDPVFADGHRHLPFWILLTQDVNAFVMANLNRFLLAAEWLMARTENSLHSTEDQAADRSEQLRNIPLLLAMTTCVRIFAVGSDLKMFPKLFKGAYNLQDKDSGDSDHEPSEDRQGLALGQSLHNSGMAWLPASLFRFNPLRFAEDLPAAFRFGGLGFNLLQVSAVRARHAHHANIHDALELELERVERDGTDAERRAVVRVAAELVVQEFVIQAFHELIDRAPSIVVDPIVADGATPHQKEVSRFQSQRQKREAYLQRLGPDEREGFHGLSLDIISRLLGVSEDAICISYPRTARRHKSFFDKFLTGRWHDRVRAIFGWLGEDDVEKPRWAGAPFRRHALDLRRIVRARLGETGAQAFEKELLEAATISLDILPRTERDRLFAMKKASFNNQKKTKHRITNTSPALKTQWMVSYFTDFDMKRRLRNASVSTANAHGIENELYRYLILEFKRVRLHESSNVESDTLSISSNAIITNRRFFLYSLMEFRDTLKNID